ncbi:MULTISPECIES: DUF4276 family protein [unclassified Frankia]|uniref:DUF4276 family protein n=1 Tax=unclassified Frankia TaxID=2632575 RepID=UPI002AD2A3C6|nr:MULTISPECIES: DUF4276 family protein [unclassified Frankia]
MRSLYLLAEGHTEFVIIDQVLEPFLVAAGFHVRKSIITTRRMASGPAKRGGVTSWNRLENEIRRVLQDPTIDVVTTMIDYYGLPQDAPGMSTRPDASAHEGVTYVETEIERKIGDPRFVPHVVLHEIESWILAAAPQLGDLVGDSRVARRLARIVDDHGGPELVDNGVTTAPSKRIRDIYPAFDKTLDGPLAVIDLGLAELRRRCPHADAWLYRLEERA